MAEIFMPIWRRLRYRSSRLLPRWAVRMAIGALADLQSLPRRFADPERRGEPWQALHNVGGGDFRIVGRQLFDQLRGLGGLMPEDRVLDIGCGVGRVAAPLADFLASGGGYAGFDISPAAIASCRRRFAKRRPDFVFALAPLRNREYRPRGSDSAEEYRFPFADASFSLAFATSVYTHMTLPEIANYLRQTARCLKPGGRLFATFFLIDDKSRQSIAADQAMPFKPWQDGTWVLDPRTPERAIAHDRDQVLAALADAGFEQPIMVKRGSWAGSADYAGFQDLILAAKPR